MRTHHKRLSKGALVASLSALLFLGISLAATADTQIEAYNDGAGISAFAASSDDVLSINIRVVGPDGFVFESRTEGSSIEWMPESDLPDGIYTWEVWTVTAERGAPMREVSVSRQSAQAVQAVDSSSPHQSSDQIGTELEEVPLERFFAPQDKNVHIESGSFRITDGWLEKLDDEFLGSTDNYNPNTAQRLIGGILDFLVPSAHAQNFTDDVVVTKANPSVILDSSASVGENWSLQGASSLWAFRDLQNSNTVIGIVPGTANANALRITDSGRIGLGTAAATEALHISDSNPRIRLQNLGDAQTWYVKNTNQGRFEISENSGNDNPFSIEAGAPATALYVRSNGNIGIGTDEPQRNLHIMGNHIRIEDTNSTWDLNPGSQGLWFNQANPTTFGVLKLQNAAPENSIVAAGGGVGIGTQSPSAPLHVRRADNSANVLVQDTGTSDPGGGQTMFELVNNGHPKFMLQDTSQSNVRWEFRTAGTQDSNERFQINKLGSGVIEARISAGGDAEFAGNVTANGVLLTSTREAKTDFAPLDGQEVLRKLASLDVSQWRYKHESPDTRHFGPVAEEFHEVFGLSNGKTLNMIDTTGISFAAIRALNDENLRLARQNEQLAEEHAKKAAQTEELMVRLERLEAALSL